MKKKRFEGLLLSDELRADLRKAGFDIELSETERAAINHKLATARGENITFGQCLAKLLRGEKKW